MTDEEIYAELPDNPEVAFLYLEKHFRDQTETKLAAAGEQEPVGMYYVEYISKVVAAIQELGIETEFETEVPNIANVSYNTYADFGKDVNHYRIRLSIRHARRTKAFSVRFDSATKIKIRHHIEQVRQIIEKLEIDEDKKERLLGSLNVFAKEVDRDRTRFEAWGAVVIQAAEILGEAAEKAEPARKWLDTIGRLIWGASEKEKETKQLPPPKDVKRIENKKETKRINNRKDLNDDVPF